jgi:hypothetical protein
MHKLCKINKVKSSLQKLSLQVPQLTYILCQIPSSAHRQLTVPCQNTPLPRKKKTANNNTELIQTLKHAWN